MCSFTGNEKTEAQEAVALAWTQMKGGTERYEKAVHNAIGHGDRFDLYLCLPGGKFSGKPIDPCRGIQLGADNFQPRSHRLLPSGRATEQRTH